MKKIFLLLFFAHLSAFIFSAENEWTKDLWDLRIIDIPKIGLLYDINGDNLLFRLSSPITMPVILMFPLNYTYASSYWGIDALLFDITFGIESWETFQLSSQILFRALSVSAWGGIPLSPNIFGIYGLLELAPLSLFTNRYDDYAGINLGIGINAGVKFFLTEYIDIDIKYENYFAYSRDFIYDSYIGLYVKYRINGAGNYVPYLSGSRW